MRVAQPVVLNPESRCQLERQARGRTVPMRVALRNCAMQSADVLLSLRCSLHE